MARNRARTWTVLERRVMNWYNATSMPDYLPELKSEAERIILTKGHCVQMTANRIVSQPDEDFNTRRDPITGWSYEEIYPALIRDWNYRTQGYARRYRRNAYRRNRKPREFGRTYRKFTRKAEKLDNAARNASNEQNG